MTLRSVVNGLSESGFMTFECTTLLACEDRGGCWSRTEDIERLFRYLSGGLTDFWFGFCF